MENFIIVLHIIISIILVGIILVQHGKGADMGAAFGGGGSNTIFGARGPATFFQKFTTILAVLFLFTSITLARFAKTQDNTSVIDTVPVAAGTVPAAAPIQEAPAAAPTSDEPAVAPVVSAEQPNPPADTAIDEAPADAVTDPAE